MKKSDNEILMVIYFKQKNAKNQREINILKLICDVDVCCGTHKSDTFIIDQKTLLPHA